MDLQGPYPTGDYLLVLIDYFNRYPIVVQLKTITTETIKRSLDKAFSIFGYPTRITTDNGPQFISDEFKTYITLY